MEPSAGPPFLRLFCLAGDSGPDAYGPTWSAGLAPEIEVVVLAPGTLPQVRQDITWARAVAGPLADQVAGLLDDRAYAVFGRGSWAWAGLEISRALAGARAPAQLMVASCPAPGSAEQPVSWPITAFAAAGAGAAEADGMASWRSVTTGRFTLRLLPDPEPGQAADWVDAGTLLAIKEEARVWPS